MAGISQIENPRSDSAVRGDKGGLTRQQSELCDMQGRTESELVRRNGQLGVPVLDGGKPGEVKGVDLP